MDLVRNYAGVAARRVNPKGMLVAQHLKLPFPARGLVINASLEQSPVESLREASCVRLYKGRLKTAGGATQLGSSLSGSVMGIFDYRKTDGTSHVVAVTPTKLYYYDVTTEDWVADTGTLSGSTTDPASWCVIDDALVFTNGTDLKRWTGAGTLADQMTTLPAGLTSLKCTCVAAFSGRLLLGNTTENGTACPQRVRYSAINSNRDFNSAGSGYYDFDDTPDPVQSIVTLGDYLFILKRDMIYYGRATGNEAAPFSFRTFAEGVGAFAANCVGKLQQTSWIIGRDSVYTLTPSGLQDAGVDISEELFSRLYAEGASRAWSVPNIEFHEVLLGIPTGNEPPSEIWIYNYRHDAWTVYVLPSAARATCAGTIQQIPKKVTIDSLTGTIDSQTWKLGAGLPLGATSTLLVGLSSGAIARLDASESTFLGSSLTYSFTSQRIFLPSKDYGELDIYLKELRFAYYTLPDAATVTVSISVDDGETFPESYTLTFASGSTPELRYATAYFFIKTSVFVFKVTSSSPFDIQGVTAVYAAGGEPR